MFLYCIFRAQASKAQGPLVFLRIIIIIFLSRFWGVLGPLTYTKTLENWHTCWNLRPLGRCRGWDPGVAQGLYGAPWKTVRKQMYISHILAHIHMKYEHISPVLSRLHWLPTKHSIDFKILLITYKALNGLAPQYLSELLSHYSPSRPLRSQNSGHLIIPRISKSTAGGRSFSYLAPKLWNNLPNSVREADTLCQFKSRLKTHLFNLAYT